jgi:uncharacterized membrane protein
MNRWLLWSIFLTLAAFAASLYLGVMRPDLLPDRVPIHWNARGEANGFVSRDNILPYFLIAPGAMTFFVLLSLALPWLSPKQYSIERFRNTYSFLMALVSTLFAYIHGVALAGSAQVAIDMNKALLGGMFLFFGLVGNLLGKVQRNFYVGIRTPWTLADETVWIRTHRVASWVWTGGSLIMLVVVLCGASIWWSLGAFLVLALFPVLYSLFLYKRLEKQGKLTSPAAASTEGQASVSPGAGPGSSA